MNLPRKQWNLLSALALAAGAAWIAVSAGLPGANPSARSPAPQAGFPAPDFELGTPGGEPIVLSDLRGKAVLVNLWASWCGPCRAEMPAIQRVYEEYASRGFEVLAVNVTNQDSVTAAVDFAHRLGLTFPILLDLDGSVSRLYGLRALPTSFFVRPDGVIEEVVIGGPMAEALLRTRVERLLEGTP